MKRKYNLLILTIILAFTLLLVSCSTTTKELSRMSTLSISTSELTIEKGEKATLFAGYDGKSEINYVIPQKDSSIVKLNKVNNGVEIIAVSDGVTYLEVSVDGHRKTCKITVITSVYEIKLNRISNSIDVYVGATHSLNAVIFKNGKQSDYLVEWEVSGKNYNHSVKGNEIQVIPNDVGAYEITAKYRDNVVARYTFNVINEI